MSRVDPQQVRVVEDYARWGDLLTPPNHPNTSTAATTGSVSEPEYLAREALTARSPAARLQSLYALTFHPGCVEIAQRTLTHALQDFQVAGRLGNSKVSGGMQNAFHAAYLHREHADSLAPCVDGLVRNVRQYFVGDEQGRFVGSGESARLEAETQLIAASQIVAGSGRCSPAFNELMRDLLSTVVDSGGRRALSSKNLLASFGVIDPRSIEELDRESADIIHRKGAGMPSQRVQRFVEVLSLFAPQSERHLDLFLSTVRNQELPFGTRVRAMLWVLRERPEQWPEFAELFSSSMSSGVRPYATEIKRALLDLSRSRTDDPALFAMLAGIVLDRQHLFHDTAVQCMAHFDALAPQALSLLTLEAFCDAASPPRENQKREHRRARLIDVMSKAQHPAPDTR